MCRWINMLEKDPDDDSEIIFIAKDGITNERIGIVVKDKRLVILKRTDISFDSILFYIQIPILPEAIFR